MSKYRYHTCRCLSVPCTVSVLSHSVESCGICLTRPGIVFHNLLKKKHVFIQNLKINQGFKQFFRFHHLARIILKTNIFSKFTQKGIKSLSQIF